MAQSILLPEQINGLRHVAASELQAGDKVFNPSAGTAYSVREDGTLSFALMAWAPIDGRVWEVMSNDGNTIVGRFADGEVKSATLPEGQKLIRMATA